MFNYKVKASIKSDCRQFESMQKNLDTVLQASSLKPLKNNEYGTDDFDEAMDVIARLGEEEWFLESAKELILFSAEEDEDADEYYAEDSLQYYRKKKRNLESNKGAVNIILIFGLLLAILILTFGVFFIGSAYSSMKWDKTSVTDSAEKSQIARKEFLMSVLADSVVCKAERGLRDSVYVYETEWFDSVDALFLAIPYHSEESRMEAMNEFSGFVQMDSDFKDFHKLEGGNMKIYQVPSEFLPLEDTIVRPANWQNSCQYVYYLVVDDNSNGRARLICSKTTF